MPNNDQKHKHNPALTIQYLEEDIRIGNSLKKYSLLDICQQLAKLLTCLPFFP